MRNSFRKLFNTRILQINQLSYSSILLLLFPLLSGCNDRVDPSFHYAFVGTAVVMAIALFIATVVTRRGDKHKHDDHNKKL